MKWTLKPPTRIAITRADLSQGAVYRVPDTDALFLTLDDGRDVQFRGDPVYPRGQGEEVVLQIPVASMRECWEGCCYNPDEDGDPRKGEYGWMDDVPPLVPRQRRRVGDMPPSAFFACDEAIYRVRGSTFDYVVAVAGPMEFPTRMTFDVWGYPLRREGDVFYYLPVTA